MLETRNLTIRFGGHVAVDHVSCAFAPGTLTAIVGPNGAGKTTYFNLISGQLPASEGQVLLDGEDITRLPAPLRTHRGLGRAFQLTQLFPNLTVQENVRLAVQARESGRGRGGLDLLSVWLDRKSWIAEAREILQSVRLDDKRDAHAAALPHGDQRKLEVALLMALDPKVFMFDEPTAGMSVDEVPVILDLIRALKARKDRLILLVEHKMDVVSELADRIIVLHNGALVADGEPAAVIASPVVQQAYLGIVPEDEDGLRQSLRTGACRPSRSGLQAATWGHHERRAATAGRAHAHRRVPHPAWRGPAGAGRPGDDAAGPQWRRQVDHAAHDHGPVGRLAGLGAFQGPPGGWPGRPAEHARDRPARHRLRAREHGHLHRPVGEGEHGAGRARRAPCRRTGHDSGWNGSSACSRR